MAHWLGGGTICLGGGYYGGLITWLRHLPISNYCSIWCYWVVIGWYWSVLGRTESILDGTGQYLVVLGHYWVVLVSN